MPPGVAVVDAFKSPFFPLSSYSRDPDPLVADLIRHGKNHVHARQDDHTTSQPPADPPTEAQPDYQWAQPERRQQAHAQPQPQSKRHQQQQHNKAQPATTKQSQQLTREAEKIVREEREAQEKMPRYKGLEHFKLVQKMGECAHLHPASLYRLLDRSYLQWSIFQRIQSFGSHIWDECRRHVSLRCRHSFVVTLTNPL